MQAEIDSARLKRIPLFAAFTEDELSALAPATQCRPFAKGARIVCAGDRATGLHVLLSGRAKLITANGEGREVILAFIHADDFFCESSLLEEQRMTVTVQALEPSETLFVPRAALLQAVWQNPAATTAMLRLLLERLQQADRKIQDFALLDVYERVARVLLDASRQEGGEWRVEPGCEQIAQMVAASREMVSRVLKDLAEKGLISRRKRRIVVLDRASIAQRAAARLSRVAQRADAQYYSSPRDGQR